MKRPYTNIMKTNNKIITMNNNNETNLMNNNLYILINVMILIVILFRKQFYLIHMLPYIKKYSLVFISSSRINIIMLSHRNDEKKVIEVYIINIAEMDLKLFDKHQGVIL